MVCEPMTVRGARAMQAGATAVAEPPFKPKRSSKKAARTKSPPAPTLRDSSPLFAAKQEYPQYHADGQVGHVPAASDFGGHFFNGYHHGSHHGHFPQQQSGYPYYHHHHYQVPYAQQQLYNRYHDADDYRSTSWEDKRPEDDNYGHQHYGYAMLEMC